jgi:hypothetical protein
MSMAAETAKVDEWDARDVDTSSVKGRDGKVIVPVHPRCRCSITVEGSGTDDLRAVFAPAPDACPWCLSYQEGEKGR